MKISTILDRIDAGQIALPEFQRGYVWNRDQVRGLLQSLYRKHPVGSLLMWETRADTTSVRGGAGHLSNVELLLDGQQRVTTLYGIIRGRSPRFFDGNAGMFTGLHFNLEDESFEFYAPLKMKDQWQWISVTKVMASQDALGEAMQHVQHHAPHAAHLFGRLSGIAAIKDTELHVESITGEDKTIDVVVDIFNRVNSGGTKLSKGDLALARICAGWPEGRGEMKWRLDKWRDAGYDFSLDWLLRCINAVVTGEALFSALKDVHTPVFREGLGSAELAIDRFLNMASGRLGLDHDRVLGSKGSLPLIARYLSVRGGNASPAERDGLLYWYVHTLLWGRYASSTETVLNQDLAAIEQPDGAIDRLIEQLHTTRGDLRLHPRDFGGSTIGARVYPLLYMLTRASHSVDWGTGVELSNHLLGQRSALELHHIFPKALLYAAGYKRDEVNAVANFAFLTAETNGAISDRAPGDYLVEYAARHPGALESAWVPSDRALWSVARYRDFLAVRRELLATAANRFLDGLRAGTLSEPSPQSVQSAVQLTQEDREVRECNEWVIGQGLPGGEHYYELIDPRSGDLLVVIDLAWPSGIQEGYSEPVALIIGQEPEAEVAARAGGFRTFPSTGSLRTYVRERIMAMDAVPV